MEKKCIVLRTGKTLTFEEAREAKRLYETLCTKEYVEEKYPHIPNASSFSVSVRNLMNKTEMTEEEAVNFLLQENKAERKEG